MTNIQDGDKRSHSAHMCLLVDHKFAPCCFRQTERDISHTRYDIAESAISQHIFLYPFLNGDMETRKVCQGKQARCRRAQNLQMCEYLAKESSCMNEQDKDQCHSSHPGHQWINLNFGDSARCLGLRIRKRVEHGHINGVNVV